MRETLHLLEASGLVEPRQKTGWVVSSITQKDVDELYEFRCLLEPVGIEKIVQWDDERLREITTMFDDFGDSVATDRAAEYLSRDDEFHNLIIAAADNSRLQKSYYVIDRQISRCKRFVSYGDSERRDASLVEHKAICDHLSRRDVAGATEKLIAHIRNAQEKLRVAIREKSLT